ncbi:hypothetical protein ACIPSA_29910 [Streptomyces sp. NPDC086549]|uniref:hypothetical protein n=1 Tax=Streptomyces sp. NPDC086549 TaxID=3365752 RepID=UPI00381E67BE
MSGGPQWRRETPRSAGHARPDLVQRDFTAPAPNRLWATDLVLTTLEARAEAPAKAG